MPAPALESADARHAPHERAWLREQIARHGLVRDARLRSATGRPLGWCFDLRTLTLDPATIQCIATLFWDQWGARWPFQVCGLEMAAVPIAMAIALEGHRRGRPVPALVVRKERKTYALARQLEGRPTRDPVVIVDDVINSAASAEKVRVVLQAESLQAIGLFALVDFASTAGLRWRERHAIAVTAPFGLADFGLARPAGPAAPAERRFEVAWRFDPAEARHQHVAPKSAPLALDGRVVFGCDDGHLVALDAATGERAWTFRTAGRSAKGIWASPVACGGRVFVGAYDGSLYAVDAASGVPAWRQPLADWIGASVALDHARGRLVVGLEHALPGRRGSVAALELDDGRLAWETPLAAFQHGTPVIDVERDQVIVGTNDGRVLACARTPARSRGHAPSAAPSRARPRSVPRWAWCWRATSMADCTPCAAPTARRAGNGRPTTSSTPSRSCAARTPGPRARTSSCAPSISPAVRCWPRPTSVRRCFARRAG